MNKTFILMHYFGPSYVILKNKQTQTVNIYLLLLYKPESNRISLFHTDIFVFKVGIHSSVTIPVQIFISFEYSSTDLAKLTDICTFIVVWLD